MDSHSISNSKPQRPMRDYAQQLFERGIAIVPLFTIEETEEYHRDFVNTLLHHTPELKKPRFVETTPTQAAAAVAEKKKRTKKSGVKRKSTEDEAGEVCGSSDKGCGEETRAQKEEKHAEETLEETAVNSSFVDGGFGAFAIASSFHNPVVRRLRMDLAARTRPLFQELAKLMPPREKPLRVEQLLDRFCIRRVGTSTTAESWHRDQSPRWPEETADNLDVVLGGWVNLDLSGGVQRFSCQPSSHNLPRGATGFAPLTSAEAEQANAQKEVFEIPSGHWAVFYQNIVHEVFPTKSLYDSMRLFAGFRLTSSESPLFVDALNDPIVQKEFKGTELDMKIGSGSGCGSRSKDITDSPWYSHVFVRQGPPPIPSGQRPPMFAAMSMAFRKQKLKLWAETELDPRVCHMKDGETLPLRFCPSLKEAGFPLFSPYTTEEIALHTPQLL